MSNYDKDNPPSMSMCVNKEDYYKQMVGWQKERIKELERELDVQKKVKEEE
jgi:hypothetical protein